MKITLFLSMLCALALFNGCSTNRGGTADPYNSSSGSVRETEPAIGDPSLPPDPNAGPRMPPPGE